MSSLLTLAELEKRHIREVLSVVGGRRGEAARILGIDRKTLYRKVMQYELDKERRRSGQYRITDEGTGGAGSDGFPPPQSSRAKG